MHSLDSPQPLSPQETGETIINVSSISDDDFEKYSSTNYPIIWIRAKIGKRTAYMGVCPRTWKPCFIGTPWLEMVWNSFDVGYGYCNASDNCLNIKCPLNAANPEDYAIRHKFKPADKKWLQDKWLIATANIAENFSSIVEKCKVAYEENPNNRAFSIRLFRAPKTKLASGEKSHE